ncbi:MAG: glycosyltransferase [Pseudomonadota bacterium]
MPSPATPSSVPLTPTPLTHVIASLDMAAAGTTVWLTRLVEELQAQGREVTTLAVSMDTATPPDLHGLQTYPSDFAKVPGVSKLLFSDQLHRAIRQRCELGSLLHVSGLWRMPNVYPGWVAKKTGCELILSPHGMLGPGALTFSAGQKKLFAALVQNRALHSVSCFHVTSEKEAADVRAYGLRAPLALIPNGIDLPPIEALQSVQALDERAPTVSTTVSTTGPGRSILYLGRVHPKKGIDKLIAAWAELEHGYPHWQVDIVGPSEIGYADDLQRQAVSAGLQRVHFHQGVYGDAKTQKFVQADIVVLPTLDENFGLVVGEALAAGTPVICTHGAPWADLHQHGCGWWIEHGVSPLQAALKDAMARPRETLKDMGQRGRGWMARDFAWPAVAQQMLALYNWIDGRAEQPPFVQPD